MKKCMDAIDEAINNEAQQGQDRLRQTAYMLHRACRLSSFATGATLTS